MDSNQELMEPLERALTENIDSLQIVEKLLAIESPTQDDPHLSPPESPVLEPVKPRPNLNSGAIALPEKD